MVPATRRPQANTEASNSRLKAAANRKARVSGAAIVHRLSLVIDRQFYLHAKKHFIFIYCQGLMLQSVNPL